MANQLIGNKSRKNLLRMESIQASKTFIHEIKTKIKDLTNQIEMFEMFLSGNNIEIIQTPFYIKNLNHLCQIFCRNSKREIHEQIDIKAIFSNITDEEIELWINEPDEK